MPPVGRRAAQIVDVRGGDLRQPPALGFAEDPIFPLQDVPQGRPGQPFLRRSDGGQQGDVWAGVAAGKAMPADGSDLDWPSLDPRADQPGELRPAQSGELAQESPYDPLRAFAQPPLLPGLPNSPPKIVDRCSPRGGPFDRPAPLDQFPHLGQGQPLCVLHSDGHPPAGCTPIPALPSGSSWVGNTPPLQAHLALDNSTGSSPSQIEL